jgi:limonene-1,2-epoxide hydrolase
MNGWNSSRRALLARGALVSVAGLSLAASGASASPEGLAAKPMTHSPNIDLILTFCKAGQDRDLEKQMSYIGEDSVYHNMPDEPIVGRAGIRALLAGYLTSSDATEIIIHNISEARSGTVLTERLDRFRINGGKWIDCPVMGAADIENGKIKQWRDYYDNLQLRAQMG